MQKYSQHLDYLACLVTELVRIQSSRMILNNLLVVLLPKIILGKLDAGKKSSIYNTNVQILISDLRLQHSNRYLTCAYFIDCTDDKNCNIWITNVHKDCNSKTREQCPTLCETEPCTGNRHFQRPS